MARATAHTENVPAFVKNGLAAQAAADSVIAQTAAGPHAEWQTVRTTSLAASTTNPRKTFDQSVLAELAESVKELGILQPILVRPYLFKANSEEVYWEIVAGERRWRAAKLAQLPFVPVRVVHLSDQQVLEVQITENLMREGVHPLEEADGFHALIGNYQYTASQIAEKVGCHESYVHKRLRLARLIEPARKAFLAEDISLQHAIYIARLDAEQQKQAFGMCIRETYDHVSGKHIRQAIPASVLDARIRTEILLDLSAAPWRKDDDMLLPKAGACTSCPKRTGSNAKLFDDFKKGDHCLDKGCFEAKRTAFVDVKVAELTHKNHAEPVRIATTWADEKMMKKLGAVHHHAVHQLTKKDLCGSAEAAIVVYGNDVGKTMQVCRDSKCSKHRSAISYAKSAHEIAAERKRKTEDKIDAAYRVELWKRTWSWLRTASDEGLQPSQVETVAHYLIERIGHDGRGPLVKLLELKDLGKKSATYVDTNSKLLKAYFAGNLTADERIMFLVALATAPALGSMFGAGLKALEETTKDLGVDCAALRKEVAAPILAKAKVAEEKQKAKAAAEKKAGQTAKPKADAKRAAANDVEEDFDEDFDGNEDYTDE